MARAEIRARATLDNKQFQAGLAQMNQGVQRFASGQLKQIGSMIGGAFAVGAVVNFAKSTLQAADAIDNTAKQLGVGVEELQALQREAELTTGSADKMTAALHRIAKAQAEAAAGDTNAVRAFEALGISLEEIQNLSPDKMFELIAQKVKDVSPASTEAAAAGDIMGRGYTELQSVIDKVANEGLENLKNQMLETGQIMSEEMVTAADRMEEAINKASVGMTNSLRNWALSAIVKIKEVAAFWGAVFGGADFADAAAIASQTVQEELFKRDATTRKTGGTVGGFAAKPGKEFDPTQGISVSAPTAADQLAKIGGIVGGQTDPMRGLAERQLKIQEKIEKHMADAQAKIDNIVTNTNNLEE